MSEDAGIRALVSQLVPALVEQALEESRLEALAALRARMTSMLLDEAELLIRDQPAASPPGTGPTPPAPLGGWYVYGITFAESAQALGRVAGVDGSPVEVLMAGRLAAVVSPISTPGSWGLDSRGEVDLTALAPRAQEHEHVLEAMLEHGPVVPLRFGVLYPGAAEITKAMVDRAAALEAALHRLVGCSEWGLSVERDGDVAEPDTGPIPINGRDYLSRRRDGQVAAERLREQGRLVVEGIHASLLDVASDGVVHSVARLPGRGPTVLLKASYLVATKDLEAFRRTAEEELASAPADLGLTGQLSGPWPPYNFADLDLEGLPA